MDSSNKRKIVVGKLVQEISKKKVSKDYILKPIMMMMFILKMVKRVLHSLTSQPKNKHLPYLMQEISSMDLSGLTDQHHLKYLLEMNKLQV